nr:DEAD/DEAH box helicase [Macrococcus goetzii]
MRILVSEQKSEIPAIEIERKIKCNFCLNEDKKLFYHYYHHGFKEIIYYCRNCITQSINSRLFIHYYETPQNIEQIKIDLPFKLTEQQRNASQFIKEQITLQQSCLLYAVTGAGKTEMILEGIVKVRGEGGNVAVVSPRTDVVKELSLRLNNYLKTEQISTLYAGHSEITQPYLIISTIHQLMYFKSHFDLIIVDEIDAFPAQHDPRLMKLLERALTPKGIFVYLSATPPKNIIRACKGNIAYLPLRHHKRPLPVPRFKYLSHGFVRKKLDDMLRNVETDEIILIFFHDIRLMEQTFRSLKKNIQTKTVCVYSGDDERHEKIEAIRNASYQFVFTTTILERGFTMHGLSVWVMNSHLFRSDSLIQIAGRVDRKGDERNGEVIFFHDGVSLSMIAAVRDIRQMNKRGAHVS